MILHVVPDEKFINMAYDIFERVYPANNKFVVVTQKKELKHITGMPVVKISYIKLLSKKFVESLTKYEFVIIHYMNDFGYKLISKADDSVKFVWIGWGGDYYDLIDEKRDKLLLPKTRKLSNKINNKYNYNLKTLIMKFIKKTLTFNIDKYKLIQKIDYFAPVLYEDYLLVKRSIENFTPRYLDWNYGTLEDDLIKGLENMRITSSNILLGNSATDTNNHMEILDILSKLEIGSTQIITPLSYGKVTYRNEVIKYAKQLFPKQFVPLIEYMNIKKYRQVLASCSVAIMNHVRQQALGNILIMMYLGAKIFLRRDNPVYDFLVSNKAIVFSIDELNNEHLKQPLTKNEIEHNRKILLNVWGREICIAKTQKLINTVNEKN